MKKILPLIAVALILSVMFTAGAESHGRCRYDDNWTFRSKSIDFEDGTLVIEHDDEDWVVEITEEYKLYVNGRRVKTGRRQKKLLRSYYRDYEDIEELAKEIAKDGAKIGLAGAKLGVSAVACAAKLLLDDYDSDDMEDEIEIKTEDLVEMADKIEKKADRIEDMADDLEKTHKKLRKSIPELSDLEDF
jgi:predicted peroxiredoxin